MILIGRRMILLNTILLITTSLRIAVWAHPEPVPRTNDAISHLFETENFTTGRDDAGHLKTAAIASRLQKRVVQSKTLRVVIHYICPLSGHGSETFEWTVSHDSEKERPGVDFIRGSHVDGFPLHDKDYSDEEYPATYIGSWYHVDMQQIDIGTHACQLDYTGHFEGEVGFSGISLIFINNRAPGAPIPTITEFCRRYKYECGRTTCPSNPVTRQCLYTRSEVFPIDH